MTEASTKSQYPPVASRNTADPRRGTSIYRNFISHDKTKNPGHEGKKK